MSLKYEVGNFKSWQENRGWIVGSFLDSKNPRFSSDVEVLYKEHDSGHVCRKHQHEYKIEIIFILSGKMEMRLDEELHILVGGDFVVIQPGVTILSTFLEKTSCITIHAPSLLEDKILLT